MAALTRWWRGLVVRLRRRRTRPAAPPVEPIVRGDGAVIGHWRRCTDDELAAPRRPAPAGWLTPRDRARAYQVRRWGGR